MRLAATLLLGLSALVPPARASEDPPDDPTSWRERSTLAGIGAQTAVEEVIDLFGPPDSMNTDGDTTWSYWRGQAVAVSFRDGQARRLLVRGQSGVDFLRDSGLDDPLFTLLGRLPDDVVIALGPPSARWSRR
jgi:hypothetical protein